MQAFFLCVLPETHFTQNGWNSFHRRQNSFHRWQNSFHQLQNSCFETKKYRIFISFASFVFKSDTNSFKIPKKWTYNSILLGKFDEKVNIFCKTWPNRLGKRQKLISQSAKTHFTNAQNSFFRHFAWVDVTGFRTKKKPVVCWLSNNGVGRFYTHRVNQGQGEPHTIEERSFWSAHCQNPPKANKSSLGALR